MKPHTPFAHPLLLTLAAALLLVQMPLGASETDDRIADSARKSYVFRTYLMDDSIQVQSQDGKVTLTGTVSEDSHKLLASDTVAGLPGVTSVVNEITIKEGPPADSDTWLYLKVKGTLAYHRSVSAYNTKVDVKQGVVTLTGEAASEAQKELTAAYAKDIEGIKEVQNEMTVVAAPTQTAPTLTEMIDDASITAQVRMALLMHRSTNAFTTTVTTAEGVVTVGGSAKNVAEKDLVTKLVTDIHGVKIVVNDMVVAAAVTTK